MSTKILRLPQIIALTGLSRSTVYNRVATGNFPTSISLGGRSVGWVASEVDAWLHNQINASRSDINQVKGDAL
jgi:prophage regulatory protein